ncbi:MAG: DUF1080 domain-containing protein, partial [Chitinophagaceae bacterium]|nr:DUF1080 domain-containing protein [Chitinophagaceae bacterium]
MKHSFRSLMATIALITGLTSHAAPFDTPAGPGSIEGRWDMTVNEDGVLRPSWLEVMHSGHKRLFGHFVGFGGSARPVAQVFFE